jgi:hypothetical protein
VVLRAPVAAHAVAADGAEARTQDRTMNMDRLMARAASLAAALALSLACVPASAADTPKSTATAGAKAAPKRVYFATPQEGFEALVAALRKPDFKAVDKLLGPGHQRITDSGDSAADREAAQRFVADYDTKHRIDLQGDAQATLSTGESDWPMPIPLVKHAAGWAFDADAGEEELIARRIGRNELDAMQVCLAFIDMQLEYASFDHDGNSLLEYATRLVSRPGKHDGLYWPAKAGEPQSPAGPRLAAANVQPTAGKQSSKPFHGYYFRILTAQGEHAPGGKRNYIVDGRLIGGVALLAWPASYLASGVKTFQCNLDGVIYERDLGPDTATLVRKINAFDPGPGWFRAK